jgi:hypothetical protein
MKTILTIIAMAVGIVQTAVPAAEEPILSLEGTQIVADCCGADCHCLTGGPPDNNPCKFAVYQADNGKYDGTEGSTSASH